MEPIQLQPLKLTVPLFSPIKLVSAIQNPGAADPSFVGELTTSLLLSKGVGMPTFTRNTTATVTDFEGIIHTAKIGEARFEGARRVENLIAYSEDFANAYYTKAASGTGVVPTVTANYGTDPNGNLTADRIQFDLGATPATAVSRLYKVSLSTAPNNIVSIWLKTTDGSTKTLYIVGGTGNNNITVTGSWTRFSFPPTTHPAYAQMQFGLQGSYGTSNTADILAWGAQVEDVTGQSVQTVGEYVSSGGVLPAPYHGAGADGVQYFATTLAGTPIAASVLKGYYAEGQRTNLALYSNDFSNAAWAKSNLTHASGTLTATAANGTLLQTVTSTSQAHVFSIQIKRKTGTGAIALTLDNGATWTMKTISASWTRYEVTQTLANPVFGIRIATSGDAIDVRHGQLETAGFSSSPILTTSASATRNSDVLTYAWGLPETGSVTAEAWSETDTITYGRVVSKPDGKTPLAVQGGNTMQSYDGGVANVFSSGGTFGTGIRKIAGRWNNGTALRSVAKDGAASPNVAYNGVFSGDGTVNFGSTGKPGVASSLFGTMKNVKIWNRALSDAEMTSFTS